MSMGCAVLGGRSWWWWPQPQNARGRAQAIAIPPLCHPPPPCFTYPAIAALAAPRGIPGEGRANARNAGWALALHCRWACALLQPASASADSFFWGHCASAKAESLAEKGKQGKLFQEAASGFRAVRMAP